MRRRGGTGDPDTTKRDRRERPKGQATDGNRWAEVAKGRGRRRGRPQRADEQSEDERS